MFEAGKSCYFTINDGADVVRSAWHVDVVDGSLGKLVSRYAEQILNTHSACISAVPCDIDVLRTMRMTR